MAAEPPSSGGPEARDALHNLCLADPLWAERYEGWTELGHGGSASVVRTHAKATGEDVALKVFPRLAPEDWARFREEVRNAQRLTSPYIVRTYSPFPRGSLAWIELELVDGPSLSHELDRRAREGARFAVDEAMEVGIAVARALVAAHEAGVIHRDVKPANILLPKAGRPVAKLGDFGISRLTGAARLTKTGLMVGTPQFAAPEVVAGGRGGPAADVYSFALCLYFILSNNRPPFELHDETSPTQWIRAHAEARPIPVTRVNPDVQPPLAALVEQALEKDPDRRPTGAEMLSILEGLGAGQVADTRTLPARGSGGGLRAGALAAVAILVVGGVVLWRTPAAIAPRTAPDASVVPAPARDAAAASVDAPPPSSLVPITTLAPAPVPSRSPVGVPSPRAADASPAFVQAMLHGDVLRLTNASGGALDDLQVTLVGSDGARFAARVGEGLGAGEELYLAFEAFTPAVPAGVHPARADVAATEPGGARRTVNLPLP